MMNSDLLNTRQRMNVTQMVLRLSTWVGKSMTSYGTRTSLGVMLVVLMVGLYSIYELNHPWSWVVMSCSVQVSCLILRGWSRMDVWERRIFLWSMVSILSFIHFLLMDPTFSGWESVYHFCSGPSSGVVGFIPGTESSDESFAYCTLNFRWNMAGWRKAISLWNFMLSGALGVQRLCIELGFGGLLPGEEAIPRECFVSIIWRLIPFWLNKWESTFGAECSSILFELPHFALELLVILPSVQIMAGRMRVLAHAPARAGIGMVPDVMRCRWIVDRHQSRFWERLRKNTRALFLIACITCGAAWNALYTPLYLENTAVSSEKSQSYAGYRDVLAGVSHATWEKDSLGDHFDDSMIRISENTTTYTCAVSHVTDCTSDFQKDMVSWMLEHKALTLLVEQRDASQVCLLNLTMSTSSPLWILNMLERDDDNGVGHHATMDVEMFKHVAFGEYFYGTELDTRTSFLGMQKQYMDKAMVKRRRARGSHALIHFLVGSPPKDASSFHAVARKHAVEYDRMNSDEHKRLVPLVELALAIMRLSCERWFSLMAVFTSFIIYRDPPEYAQQYIRILATMCRVFQQTIIMSFPAVCWGYGAGFVFSLFASIVFWAGPIVRMVERIKKVATEVRPVHWHAVTHDEIDRMGGNCAICWGDIDVSDDARVGREDSVQGLVDDGDEAMGLVCGHAYHKKCIIEWLHSCFRQSRRATCPMCQSHVPLQVQYKFVSPFTLAPGQGAEDEPQARQQQQQLPRHAAIPGLAAIAGRMPEEFTGRFDMPQQGDQIVVQRAVWGHAPPAAPDNEDVANISEDESDNEREDDLVGRVLYPMQGYVVSPESHTNSSTEMYRNLSADALIIEESDSENSGSSIHLPSRPVVSCSTEEDSQGSDSEDDGSSAGGRRGPLRGIYGRLRPRKWRQ